MLLQQITFVSFYLLALSSLCQVSGYRYRPKQEDQLECEIVLPTFVVKSKLINECEEGLCRSIIHFVNDEEVAKIPVDTKRYRQSDACTLPCLLLPGGACVLRDHGDEIVITVCLRYGERWTVEIWKDGELINCKEIEDPNSEPIPEILPEPNPEPNPGPKLYKYKRYF